MRRRTFFFALLVGTLAGGAHPLRTPAATNTPHCRAIDLGASARWHHAKTVLQGIVIITNRAAMGCRLLVGTDGQPTIALLDSGGHPLPLRPPKLSGPHIFTTYGGFFQGEGHD